MSWLLLRASRRTVRNVSLVVLGAVSAGLAVWMANAESGDAEALVGVAGLFVSLAALGLALADFLRGAGEPPPDPAALADDLARTVSDQWLEEARARRLRDPRVLPLAWSATGRRVADRPDPLTGSGDGARVVRLRLDGRLDGRFDEAARRLADGYGQVPSGRLVVLGEPGAGKTVLALALTLGLLGDGVRTAGGRVPVLLAVSSWDPVRESLDDWIVHSLAASYYGGRETIPRTLLDRGLLLPVLDGLDEIPEAARRSAVRAVNHTLGAERPVVVTCRSAEYEDVVAGGAPVLRRAPVVEIAPVRAEDAVGYLKEVDWPDGTDWERVYDRLRNRASDPVSEAVSDPVSEALSDPVSEALSTPLMVSLARMVYQRCGGDPAELLDTGRFDCRHAVEDHLTDRVIDAAYAPERLPSGEPVDASRRGPDADQARRWLTFLAVYLHEHRERDLAWWQLSQRLLSPWVAPGIGLGLGVLVMAGVSAYLAVLHRNDQDRYLVGWLGTGVGVGAGFAIVSIVLWYACAGRPPGRLSLALRGSLGRLRRAFAAGVALTAIPAVPILTTLAVLVLISGDRTWTADDTHNFHTMLATVGGLAGSVGLALAVHNWLDAPPARSALAGPADFLRQDRRSSLAAALATGVVLSVALVPAMTAGQVTVSLVEAALTGWSAEPPLADLIAEKGRQSVTAAGFPLHHGEFLIGWVAVLPGALAALLVLLVRAWPRFLVVRATSAVRGRLPWRLMDFLADARRHGLLRQSGGTYQFRHIRLQERLASRSLAADRPTVAAPGAVARRRVLRVAAAAPVLLAPIGLSSALPRDLSRASILTGGAAAVALRGDTLVTADFDAERLRVRSVHTRTQERGRPPSLTVHSADSDSDSDSDLDGVAFGSSGAVLATATTGFNTDESATVQVWNVDSGKRVSTIVPFKNTDDILRLALSADGQILAIVGDMISSRVVGLWNPGTGRRLGVLPLGKRHSPTVIALDGHGEVLATSRSVGTSSGTLGEPVTVWDVGSGKPLADLPVPRHNPVTAMALSPNGETVATGHTDGTLTLWFARTGERWQHPLTGHIGSITAMAFNAGGDLLATSGADGRTRLWDIPPP